MQTRERCWGPTGTNWGPFGAKEPGLESFTSVLRAEISDMISFIVCLSRTGVSMGMSGMSQIWSKFGSCSHTPHPTCSFWQQDKKMVGECLLWISLVFAMQTAVIAVTVVNEPAGAKVASSTTPNSTNSYIAKRLWLWLKNGVPRDSKPIPNRKTDTESSDDSKKEPGDNKAVFNFSNSSGVFNFTWAGSKTQSLDSAVGASLHEISTSGQRLCSFELFVLYYGYGPRLCRDGLHPQTIRLYYSKTETQLSSQSKSYRNNLPPAVHAWEAQ